MMSERGGIGIGCPHGKLFATECEACKGESERKEAKIKKIKDGHREKFLKILLKSEVTETPDFTEIDDFTETEIDDFLEDGGFENEKTCPDGVLAVRCEKCRGEAVAEIKMAKDEYNEVLKYLDDEWNEGSSKRTPAPATEQMYSAKAEMEERMLRARDRFYELDEELIRRRSEEK